MKWDKEISVGMPMMKCANKPSTKTFKSKDKKGVYHTKESKTCSNQKSYEEEKDRKGQDPDIDPTRSIDNVSLEIENGEVISYDNIPENAEKFTSKYYLDRIDELTDNMNEERDVAKSKLAVKPEKSKARPYAHIQSTAVNNVNIIFKPKMEQINEMPKALQQEFFTDMYKCAYDTIQELCQSDKIKGTTNNRVILTNATIHNDELAPHMHTDFTIIGEDKNGFTTYSYNKVFSNTKEGATNGMSNLNHIVRDKMRELGWNIKEIVDTSEMTEVEKREYRINQGMDSNNYKYQQQKKAEELKTRNKEMQEAMDIDFRKYDKEITEKGKTIKNQEEKIEAKNQELETKNKENEELEQKTKEIETKQKELVKKSEQEVKNNRAKILKDNIKTSQIKSEIEQDFNKITTKKYFGKEYIEKDDLINFKETSIKNGQALYLEREEKEELQFKFNKQEIELKDKDDTIEALRKRPLQQENNTLAKNLKEEIKKNQELEKIKKQKEATDRENNELKVANGIFRKITETFMKFLGKFGVFNKFLEFYPKNEKNEEYKVKGQNMTIGDILEQEYNYANGNIGEDNDDYEDIDDNYEEDDDEEE